MNGMIMHCGAQAATIDQVAAVETPEPTNTHFPIRHLTLVNRLREVVESKGLTISDEAHALNHEGGDYFGIFQIAGGDDFNMVVGARNSHLKRYAAGLAAGSRVMVCDNLSFSGDVTLSRKHTRHILRDLGGLVTRAFGLVSNLHKTEAQRFAQYKQVELTNQHAHDLMIQAMACGAIAASKLPKVLEQWRAPNHPEFRDRTVWSLFNGFSEIYKEYSLENVRQKSLRLQGLLDNTVGFAPTIEWQTDDAVLEDADGNELAVVN